MKQAIGIVLLFLLASPSVARAQGSSSLTYQGRLDDGAVPANGSYDLQFKIFPAATGGAAYWQTTLASVPVSGGLFSVVLGDALNPLFPGLFDGSERWLEIGVKPAGSPDPYTTLSPRQALTSAPNALFSSTTGDPNVQRRTIPPACPAGQYLRSLAADGTPTCVADATGTGTVTAVTASAPLASSGGAAPNLSLVGTIGILNGGTGATTTIGARANLGVAAAGANSDITSLSALSTPLSLAQGGTGSATQNFVDLTATQTVGGNKTFTGANVFNATQTLAPVNPAAKGLVVKSAAGQTANLIELQDPFGTVLSTFDPAGTFNGNTNGNTTRLGVNPVSALAPAAGQMLRFSGAEWEPSTLGVGIAQGGTGASTASGALVNLGGAARGANSDITSLSALSTPLSVVQGGTGSATQNFVDLATAQTVGGNKTFTGANAFSTTQTMSTGNPAAPGIIVRGEASQTASLMELRDSADTVLSSFGPTGVFNGNISGTAASAATIGGLACANGQVLKWSGAAWACGPDVAGSGTVTSLATGAGLSGGPISIAGTVDLRLTASGGLSKNLGAGTNELGIAPGGVSSTMIATGAVGAAQVDASQVQVRVSGTCGTGFAVRSVKGDGTVVCADTRELGFTRTTLDLLADVGRYSSIRIGSDGLGLVGYYDATGGDLKAVHCADIACTTPSVPPSTLDATGNVGQYASIAIGTDGLGLISYYDASGGNLKVAHCADTACSSATVTTLDSAGNVGQHTSIAIGLDGLGLISYYDAGNGDLKVAHCSDTACSAATLATLDSAGDVGQFTSIAIVAGGRALIAYYDVTSHALKTAHCADAACTGTSVTPAILDTGGPSDTAGTHASVAVASDGFGRIGYSTTASGGRTRVFQCFDAECTSGSPVDVDFNAGQYTSMAFASDGWGLIAYYYVAGGDLRVSWCHPLAGCSAGGLTLDSVGDVGSYASVAMGADGLGLISYYDAAGRLRVAHCPDHYCTPAVNGSVGVTSVTAGSGLSGGTVTTAGTLSVDFTAVAAASHAHTLSGEVTGALGSTTVANAVSANTADAIVRRDPSGNFSAGTITADALSAATTSTAGAFNYAAPLASSYMVGECAFVERSGLGVRCGLGDGAAPEAPGTSPFGLGAPVNLPHDAIITAVTFYVLDNDAALDLVVLLSSFSPATGGGASPIAVSLSAGANSAVQAITTSGLSVIVDNTTRSYGVNVFTTPSAWPGAASNPNLRIYGARVDYTMARPAR